MRKFSLADGPRLSFSGATLAAFVQAGGGLHCFRAILQATSNRCCGV
jgi:hypothetical protein